MKLIPLLPVLVIAVTLMPVAANAAEGDSYGIDCATETMWQVESDGRIGHYPAYEYEIAAACGQPATVVWSDADWLAGALWYDGDAPVVAAPIEAAPVEVAPDPEPTPEVQPAPAPVVQLPAVAVNWHDPSRDL